MNWLLDRLAHLALHHPLPGMDVRKMDWGPRENIHMWGLERCAQRHFDDARCWQEVELNTKRRT